MVSTRSRTSKEELSPPTVSPSSTPVSATTDSSDDEDDSADEEEFEIDQYIWDDPELRPKVEKIIDYILKSTPTMEDILRTPMRLRNKVKIFQLRLIYEQTMPMTDERVAIRSQLQRMFMLCKRDYKNFVQRREEVLSFEKEARRYSEYAELQQAIFNLEASHDIKKIIYRKFLELKESIDPDFKLKTWIREALKLPFDRIKTFSCDEAGARLQRMRAYMDQELYGMTKVKEQLLLFLHKKLIDPASKGCCLGLVGPPGVGKTTLAKCLARAMELPLEQVSFGGAGNPDFIKGHDFTYVGSKPGEIVRCLSRMGCKNGILFFDEYEKISENKDLRACLLHITDFTQNTDFRDNYFSEFPIDLSALWFIYSMNAIPEDPALKDRIALITVDGYTENEKTEMARDFLIPRISRSLRVPDGSIIIPTDVIRYLVHKSNEYSLNNKGIREIERVLTDVFTKISFLIAHKTMTLSFGRMLDLAYPVHVTRDMVDQLLRDYQNNSPSHASMYI